MKKDTLREPGGVEAKHARVPQMARLPWATIQKRYVGRKFVRRRFGTQCTLRVVDVTLGGDVCVYQGRYRLPMMPQEEFLEWVKGAKEVT